MLISEPDLEAAGRLLGYLCCEEPKVEIQVLDPDACTAGMLALRH